MKIASKLFLGFIIIAFSGGITGYVGYSTVVNIIELDDPEKLENEIDKTLGTIVLLSTISIVLAIGMGFIISSSIAIPLKKLQSSVKEITEGNLDAKITHKKNDEIGELSDTFNSMIDSLKKNVDIEKELAQEKLKKERMGAIGELAARLAHDLRNPLGIVQNEIEMIDMIHSDISKEQIARLRRAVNRMSHQIENVMDFVKVKSVELENVSCLKIFNNVLKTAEIRDGVTVNLPKNDFIIQCDEKLCEVLFYNVITNAIQAIGEGEGDGKITIRIKEKDAEIIVEIEDSGIGISNKDLQKIFDPLFTTKQFGTGLGLASCKNIIEQFGGKISVRNNPTVFTLIFPKTILKD